MPRDYEDYLNDILDAIRKIETFTKEASLKHMLGK